jgi:hypothetical protein
MFHANIYKFCFFDQHVHTNDYVVTELLKTSWVLRNRKSQIDPRMEKRLNRIRGDRRPQQQTLLICSAVLWFYHGKCTVPISPDQHFLVSMSKTERKE